MKNSSTGKSFCVRQITTCNKYKIYKSPETQSAERKKFRDPTLPEPQVESVSAEAAEDCAEDKRCAPAAGGARGCGVPRRESRAGAALVAPEDARPETGHSGAHATLDDASR